MTKLLETWKRDRKHFQKIFWKDEYLSSLTEKIPLFHKQLKTSNLGEPKEDDIIIYYCQR